jgi:hypothetical protein
MNVNLAETAKLCSKRKKKKMLDAGGPLHRDVMWLNTVSL